VFFLLAAIAAAGLTAGRQLSSGAESRAGIHIEAEPTRNETAS
jgi:hypothetical protein